MNDPKTKEFFVPGTPRAGGSKTPGRSKSGGLFVRDASKYTKEWRAVVALAAKEAMGDMPPFLGAVRLDIVFHLPRPKKHYRTGKFAGLLRDDAPSYHYQKPDRDKLLRSTQDAMKGIVYRDDAQVVLGNTTKYWGVISGASIKIETLSED